MFRATLNRDPISHYDRMGPNYDKLHRRWLKHGGGEAQAALEAAVRVAARPDTNLLDAGCGTGSFARRLIAEGMSPARITLLDPSGAMLMRCADIPVRKLNGRIEALPFEDCEFDIVTCAWVLETGTAPEVALRELCRVVRCGGLLCLAFCAEAGTRGVAEWLMRQTILHRGSGQFLYREKIIDIIRRSGEFEVRLVPSGGPAATLIAKRSIELDCTARHFTNETEHVPRN